MMRTASGPLLALALGTLATGCLGAPGKLSEGQFADVIDHDGDAADDTAVDGDTTSATDATADADATTDTRPDDADTGPLPCDDPAELLTSACLPTSVELSVFEPEHDGAGMGAPTALTRPQRGDGASSWARAAEPLEVALTNGSRADPTLLAYFTFDDTLANAVGAGYALVQGPPPGAAYAASQPGMGKGLEIGGRFGGPITAPGSASFTLMGWFDIDPSAKSTATFDLIGFEPAQQQPPELALGVAAGAWKALVDGTSTAFGTVAGGWQHVALTWDQGLGMAVLYLDGRVATVLHPSLDVASARFFVGAGLAPNPGPGVGAWRYGDDIAVFSRALEPAEVRAHAESHRPFGSALVATTQPDFDDLRVVRDGSELVPREIIGRRPHGDSGAEQDGVLGVWPLDDGSLVPSWVADDLGASDGDVTPVAETGAFGDAGGAMRLAALGRIGLAFGRTRTWGDALSVELWVKVAVGEAAITCSNAYDGATLITTQDGAALTSDGWTLRLCSGHLELTTSVATVSGATDLADGAWHHVMAAYDGSMHELVVDGFVDASATTSGTPSDSMKPLVLLHHPPLEVGVGDPPHITDAALDDLVVHAIVRPVGYAYNRAWPRLPHVRFLVATDDASGGSFPLPTYALRAGNAAVAAPVVNDCGSLVSRCTGYVAWWRFDDPTRGGLAIDSALDGRHLGAAGGLTWTAGADGGLAASLDGATQSLSRDQGADFGLDNWNVEAAVRPASTTDDGTVVERPGPGVPPDVGLNYSLQVDAGGIVRHVFRTPPGGPTVAQAAQTLVVGAWAALGGGYAAASLGVSVGGVVTNTTATTVPPADKQGAPIFLGRGGKPDAGGKLHGDLDDVRIMDRKLTADELRKLPPLAWSPR
ncbi:MAG: LamG-like jellyroll fold domain-containing protein [Myxococcota bacterium]